MDGRDDRGAWPVVPGYELHEVVGRSPGAAVYRATHLRVDRPVAVKVVDDVVLDDAAGRRLQQEVRALGALADHPHVAGVIDAGTTATGAPYVAMELVPAGSIGDRLRAFGPMPAPEVARVGAEVADALEAAHTAGIIHRAIAPDNILVGRRGRALLTDFGLATLDDQRPGVVAATAGALAATAPEVLRGAPPTPASDVFALGAALYAMATGRPAGPDRLPLPPEVPFALVDVVESCLAEPPAERPRLDEVATALEAVAAGSATAPPSAAVPDPLDDPAPTSAATLGPLDEPAPASAAVPDPVDEAAPAGAGPAAGPQPGDEDLAPMWRPPRVDPAVPTRRLAIVAVLIALSILAAVVLAVVAGSG